MLNRNINKNLLRLSQNLKQRGNFVESPDVDINKWFSDNEVVNDNSFIPIGWNVGKIFSVNGTTYSFSRDTGAYRYNASGIIEWMDVNVPRIDWTNSKWQGLLLESDNYNYAHWDISRWFTDGVVTETSSWDSNTSSYIWDKAGLLYVNTREEIGGNVADTDLRTWIGNPTVIDSGTHYEMVETNTNTTQQIYFSNSVLSGDYWKMTLEVKAGSGNRFILINPFNTAGTSSDHTWLSFNPTTEEVITYTIGGGFDIKGNSVYYDVINLGDGWYKMEIMCYADNNSGTTPSIRMQTQAYGSNYLGDGTSSVLLRNVNLQEYNDKIFDDGWIIFSIYMKRGLNIEPTLSLDTTSDYWQNDITPQANWATNTFTAQKYGKEYYKNWTRYWVAHRLTINKAIRPNIDVNSSSSEWWGPQVEYSYKEPFGATSPIRNVGTFSFAYRASDHLDDISIIPGRYTQGGTLKTYIEGEIENAWTWKSEVVYNGTTQSRVFSGGSRGYMKWNDNQRGFLDTASGMSSRSETWNLLGDGTWAININGTQSTNSSVISENKVFYERQWYRGSYNGTFSFFDNNRYLINEDFFNKRINLNTNVGKDELITYPNDFTQADWRKNVNLGVNVVANQILAPDGIDLADKIEEISTSTGFHYIRHIFPQTSVIGNLFTVVGYLKAGEITEVSVSISTNTSSGRGLTIDLTDGSYINVSEVNNDVVENFGNGWYKFSFDIDLTGLTSTGDTQLLLITNLDGNSNHTGVIGNGFYAWGVQLYENNQLLDAIAYTNGFSTDLSQEFEIDVLNSGYDYELNVKHNNEIIKNVILDNSYLKITTIKPLYNFTEGANDYITLVYTSLDVTGEYFELRIYPTSSGVVASSGTLYYIRIDSETYKLTVFSSTSYQQTANSNLVVNLNEWNVIRLEKTDSGYDLTLNGTTESVNTVEFYWIYNIGSGTLGNFGGYLDYVDAGDNGYWSSNTGFVDEVNNNDAIINLSNYRTNNVTALSNNNTQWDFIEFETKSNDNLNVNLYGDNTYTFGISFSYVANPTLFRLDNSYNLYRYNSTWEPINKLSSSGTNTTLSSIKIESTNEIDSLWVKNIKAYKQIVNLELTGNNNQEGIWTPLNLNSEAVLTYTVNGSNSYPQWVVRMGEGPGGDNIEQIIYQDGTYEIGNDNYHSSKAWLLDPNNSTTGVDGSDYLIYSNSSQWEYFPGTANYTFGTFSIYISSDETSNYNLLTTVDNISVWSNDVVNTVKVDIVIADISTNGYMTMKWSDTNFITFSSIGYYTLEESDPNSKLQFIMDPNGMGSSNVEISYLKIYQSSYNNPEIKQWGIWPLGIDEQYLNDITFTSPVISVSISVTDIWAPINTLSFNNNRKMWIRGLLWEGSGYDFGNVSALWYSNNQLNRTTYLNDITGHSDIRGDYSWNDLGQLDGYISVNNWDLNNLSLVIWTWMNGSVHLLPRSDEDGYADIGLIKKDNLLSLGPFGVTVSWTPGWNQYAITLNGATISYYHNGNYISTYKHHENPMTKRWLQLNNDVSNNWGGNYLFNDTIRNYVNQRCLYFDGTGNTYISANWSNPIETSVNGFTDIWIKPTNPTNGRFVDASTGGEMFRCLQVRSDNTIGSFIAKQDYAVISDGSTGGNTTYSAKTWDWDNGDWYKISVGKERNESNDGTNLYVKVNDEIAIQWYVSDADKVIEGYTFAWDLDEIGQRSGGINFYEGYIHSITFPNGLSLNFEEGFGDSVYSNEGDEFTLVYSGVDSSHVRLEQFDAPLISNSGDYVGWGYAKALDLSGNLRTYLEGGGTDTYGNTIEIPFIPANTLSSNVRLYTTNNLGGYRIQHRAATAEGDTSQAHVVDGKQPGFYEDSNGIYGWIVTDYSENKGSSIEIENFTGGYIDNGAYTFFYQTNLPFKIRVQSSFFEDLTEGLYNDYDNLTDDPDGVLSAGRDASLRPTLQGVYDFYNNVNADSTAKETWNNLYIQYLGKTINQTYDDTLSASRLDICSRFVYENVITINDDNRNIYTRLSDSGFVHNLDVSTGDGARSSGMFGVSFPPIDLIQIRADASLNTIANGGDEISDTRLKFYFGSIRNNTIIPKLSYSNTDINSEDLIFSNRIDYSYFNNNYNTPAFKTDRTTNGYGILKNPILFNNDSVIKIESLFTNYIRATYSTLVGSSLGDNYHIGLHNVGSIDLFSWRWDGSLFSRNISITLSNNLPFILSIDVTKNITTSVNMSIYDTDYNILDSWDFYPDPIFSNDIDSLYSSNNGDRIPIATIPWTKIWIGGTLSHFWTSFDTTTAKLYDVVGLNHATISTNNLSNNWENQTSWNPLWELGFNDNVPGQFNKNIDVNGIKLRYTKHTYLPISNVETYTNKFSDGTPYSTWFTVEDKNEIIDTTYIGRKKNWIYGFSGSVAEDNNLGLLGWWNSTLSSDDIQSQWENFNLDIPE